MYALTSEQQRVNTSATFVIGNISMERHIRAPACVCGVCVCVWCVCAYCHHSTAKYEEVGTALRFTTQQTRQKRPT